MLFEEARMKIPALVAALALAGGAAFAVMSNATAKAPDTAASAKKAAKHQDRHHKKVAKKHVARGAKKQQVSRETTSYEPQTNVNDSSRQSRMDEALSKYRQGHG
jgi:Spy/CpxP family protein refolding chaperone